MTDYEYIMNQVRKFHYMKWDEGELSNCKNLLPNLSRQELTALYYSKWLKEDKELRSAVFNALFADKVGRRVERIKSLDTDALLEEFKDKKSGNVALIRKEMRERYKADKGSDRSKIANAFNRATKGDQRWVKSQIYKERYGDYNYQRNRHPW